MFYLSCVLKWYTQGTTYTGTLRKALKLENCSEDVGSFSEHFAGVFQV